MEYIFTTNKYKEEENIGQIIFIDTQKYGKYIC